MDDEQRRKWLFDGIYGHALSSAHVKDADMKRVQKARAQTFIDAGWGLDLFNEAETKCLGYALERGETDKGHLGQVPGRHVVGRIATNGVR